jgi:hypothetical protein
LSTSVAMRRASRMTACGSVVTGHEPVLLGVVADDGGESHATLLVLIGDESAVGGVEQGNDAVGGSVSTLARPGGRSLRPQPEVRGKLKDKK